MNWPVGRGKGLSSGWVSMAHLKRASRASTCRAQSISNKTEQEGRIVVYQDTVRASEN